MDKLFELNKKLYSAHTGVGFGVIASSKQTVVLPVGGWVELARTTLGSESDNIDVTSLADKRYYMVLGNGFKGGTGNPQARFQMNTDTSSLYASRYEADGATDVTLTTDTDIFCSDGFTSGDGVFTVGYFANLSAKEKLVIAHSIANRAGTGAGNPPNRWETVGKYVKTTEPIDAINYFNGGEASSEWGIGSECVVLGWDPADVHTNNFWEELASVTGSGSTSFDSGTFTAKKYLWVQYWYEGTSNVKSQVNSDTGTNYSTRRSTDGGADFTEVNQVGYTTAFGFAATGHFVNIFIVNNSATEKLAISNTVAASTAGAGTAPSRQERVWKWDNTSSQITSIQLTANSGTFASGAEMRVWGSN